jgi:hypothetical protein
MRIHTFIKDKASPLALPIFILACAILGTYLLMPSQASTLTGDINSDGSVDITDLSLLLSSYRHKQSLCVTNTTYTCDLNADNTVDVFDLSVLLSNYGKANTSNPAVIPPSPPSAYALPTGAVAVNSVSALSSALSGSSRDIILEDGTYSSSSPLSVGNHRLWARNLGGVHLNFGLHLSGGEVHGLNLNVTSTAADSNGSDIFIDGVNSGVYDSWLYGNHVVGTGVADRTTSGLVVKRVVVNGFTDYGIFFQTYYPQYSTDNPAVKPVITDADISQIYEANRGASDGTGEAGLWAGTGCTCDKLKIRDTGWDAIWTGANANDGIFSNFDIDNIHGTVPSTSSPVSVGVYLEHWTRRNTFTNFVIGNVSSTGVRVGFNCEWADPSATGLDPVPGESLGACHNNTITNGTLYTSVTGISLEDAVGTTVSKVKFVGQSFAALKDFMTAGSGQSTIWQNQNNDFSGLPSGVPPFTTQH